MIKFGTDTVQSYFDIATHMPCFIRNNINTNEQFLIDSERGQRRWPGTIEVVYLLGVEAKKKDTNDCISFRKHILCKQKSF